MKHAQFLKTHHPLRKNFTKVRITDAGTYLKLYFVPKGYEFQHAIHLFESGVHVDFYDQHVADWRKHTH